MPSLVRFTFFFSFVAPPSPSIWICCPSPRNTDNRGERSLIPLMCDMLLDARSGDVGLWSPILADACRHHDLRRELIMRVFPRVVRSRVADAFARSGAALAASWEEVSWFGNVNLPGSVVRIRCLVPIVLAVGGDVM